MLCAGCVVVDAAKLIDHYPPVDHLAVIESVSLSPGGPGLNLAIDLARLGAPFPVSVAGVVGDDSHADVVARACAEVGVDTKALRREPRSVTSFTDCMVEREGGRRTFFHHPGANDLLAVPDVPIEDSPARILHLGAPGLLTTLDAVDGAGHSGWVSLLHKAREVGMQTNLELVSLEPERVRELALPCLPLLDTLVINEIEAAALVGVQLEAPDAADSAPWAELESLARRLVELGVRRLAVVHFPAGAVAAEPGGRVWRQGSVQLPRGRVISTTGAGDAFAAGVVFGVHEGWPVERCLEAGVAAAAACVQSATTAGGIGRMEQNVALARSMGFRSTVRSK